MTTTGGLKCWGVARVNGTMNDSSTATDFPGLSSGVAAVAVGNSTACAVLTSGALKCWGSNFHGQLGDGTTTDSLTPVQVSGLTSGVVAISAGDSYVCALMDSGALKCWGRNLSGQLGDGTETDSNVPVDVIGLDAPAKAVAAGGGQTCVLIEVNDVRCVGANYYGGLGNGTEDNSSTYGKVIGLGPVGSPSTATPNLPATGSNNDVLVVLAFTLLATGLIIVARRRVTYTNS